MDPTRRTARQPARRGAAGREPPPWPAASGRCAPFVGRSGSELGRARRPRPPDLAVRRRARRGTRRGRRPRYDSRRRTSRSRDRSEGDDPVESPTGSGDDEDGVRATHLIADDPDGSDRDTAWTVYSSRRRRSRSRLRGVAILVAAIGLGLSGVAIVNLYVPDTVNPVELSVEPVIGLGGLAVAGWSLVILSVLLYVYARRAEI